jgi:adenylate cyclase
MHGAVAARKPEHRPEWSTPSWSRCFSLRGRAPTFARTIGSGRLEHRHSFDLEVSRFMQSSRAHTSGLGAFVAPVRAVVAKPHWRGQGGQRRTAAILASDVVGYSRLMESDEHGTHERLMHLRFEVMEPIIATYQGRVIKNTGDGFLAMFDNAGAGLEAARDLQRSVIYAEAASPAEQRIAFRMGLNVADVILEDHDVYGDGVNVAARLQTHAEPNGIVISGLVAEQVGGTLGMQSVDLGQIYMRNRHEPVRVLSLRLAEAAAFGIGEVQPGTDSRPSIAVLPFRKIAAGDDAYFADGIVDNIVQSLAALRELFVIARGSTLGFGGGPIDAHAVGTALGVRYLLYGSVQRSGDQLRIGTELNDVETGEVLRADHYDGNLSDLFLLQDRIAEQTVRMIAPRVRQRELKRALKKHAQNMTAYDLVLQALEPMHRLDYASFSRARGLLQRAMVVDPSYAPAFALAARWHSIRVGQGWSPNPTEDQREAARLAELAIECDPDDPTALSTYAHVQSFLYRSFDEAIRKFDRALTACPNSDLAWSLSSATYGYVGDGPEAVRRAETGVRLSPLDSHVYFAQHLLSQAHYINGSYQEALHWGERSFASNPRLTSNLRILAASKVALGRSDEARADVDRHRAIEPGFSLLEWTRRTPLQEGVATVVMERLRTAGMSD